MLQDRVAIGRLGRYVCLPSPASQTFRHVTLRLAPFSSAAGSSSAITIEDLDREFRHVNLNLESTPAKRVNKLKLERSRSRTSSEEQREARHTGRAKGSKTSPLEKSTIEGIRHQLAMKAKLKKLASQQMVQADKEEAVQDLQRRAATTAWSPRKRLSREAMDGVRLLHARDPLTYSTPVLASHLNVSGESIRRILKSKWRPNEDEAKDMQRRAEQRRVERIRWYRQQKAVEMERMGA